MIDSGFAPIVKKPIGFKRLAVRFNEQDMIMELPAFFWQVFLQIVFDIAQIEGDARLMTGVGPPGPAFVFMLPYFSQP